jgi:hypothetical protein
MPRLIAASPSGEFRLRLTYDDGVEGDADLSHLAGKGVFKAWLEPGLFEQVEIGPNGELRWNEQLDLCADSLYLELTGKTVEQAFPHCEKSETLLPIEPLN